MILDARDIGLSARLDAKRCAHFEEVPAERYVLYRRGAGGPKVEVDVPARSVITLEN